MGIDITVTDPEVSYRDLGIGYAPPEIDGLIGWFFLGDSEAFSLANHAPGGADATGVSGVPTYEDGYASFGTGIAINTGLLETDEYSVIVVARNTDTLAGTSTIPAFASTRPGVSALDPERNSNGSRMSWTTGGALLFMECNQWNGSAGVAVTATVTSTDDNAWKCVCARVEADLVDIREMVEGTSDTTAISDERDPSLAPWRIGNGVNLTAGSCDVAAAVFFNRKITDPERTQVYEVLQAEMATRGITI